MNDFDFQRLVGELLPEDKIYPIFNLQRIIEEKFLKYELEISTGDGEERDFPVTMKIKNIEIDTGTIVMGKRIVYRILPSFKKLNTISIFGYFKSTRLPDIDEYDWEIIKNDKNFWDDIEYTQSALISIIKNFNEKTKKEEKSKYPIWWLIYTKNNLPSYYIT